MRVGIGGHALLKDHKTRGCTLAATREEPDQRGGGRLTMFLCMSSILFLTLTIMLSNMPKGFLTSCAAEGVG